MLRRTIVWAEDKDEIFRPLSEGLSAHLESRGIEVEIHRARDGNEVFRHKDGLPHVDLYLLDLQMDKYDGLQTIQSLSDRGVDRMAVVSRNVHSSDFRLRLAEMQKRRTIVGAFNSGETDWFDKVYDLLKWESPCIMHLSDIHFGRFHAYQGTTTLAKDLTPHIAGVVEQYRPNLVVISGDLTSTGDVSEFDEAELFVDWLSRETGLGLERFVCVPGNHDLLRREAEPLRFRNYVSFLNEIGRGVPEFLSRYPALYDPERQRLEWSRSRKSHREELYCFGVIDDLQVVVAGLTSAVDKEENFSGADVPTEQLRELVGHMGRLQKRTQRYLKLVTMHHHLFQVPSTREENNEFAIANQGLVMTELIRLGFQVMLHGHTHYPTAYRFQPHILHGVNNPRALTVISSGTLAGAHLNEAHPEYYFSLIRTEWEKDLPVRLVLQPYSRRLDALTWQEHGEVEFPI